MDTSSPAQSGKRRRATVDRVLVACDFCKLRKVKCDGALPCSYCTRRNRQAECTFTSRHQHATTQDSRTPLGSTLGSTGNAEIKIGELALLPGSTSNTGSKSQDDSYGTEVPLESRLLRDAQGKFIFIGDCAPLSFLQTARHLVAKAVQVDWLPLQASRDSIVENTTIEYSADWSTYHFPDLPQNEVGLLVSEYLSATNGIVDLFDGEDLVAEVSAWLRSPSRNEDVTSVAYCLVLAIGAQERRAIEAESWFKMARTMLLTKMCSSMSVAIVQGFVLITIYLLRASQPNGAYLYFSLAARTAYTTGIHRSEASASFGKTTHSLRDRIWKSLRIVDMLLSCVLARPPSTSDMDCSVKYNVAEINRDISYHILDASVEIFLIIERVVVEVYSRKRISLRIADFVARQLKAWANKWYRSLIAVTSQDGAGERARYVRVGACQVLCCYFHGIMLLTRPFFIYDLYDQLGSLPKVQSTVAENDDKRRYSDAALEAATAMVTIVESTIQMGHMPTKMPLVTSWLFTASLVLALGLLGRSEKGLEEPCQTSITCLEHFAVTDPQAKQYSIIAQDLQKTTVKHMNESSARLQNQRKEASLQLFGLLSSDQRGGPADTWLHSIDPTSSQQQPSSLETDLVGSEALNDWSIYDADFFAVPWFNQNIDEGLQDFLQPGRQGQKWSFADVPLFLMDDQTTGFFSTSLASGH